MSTVIEFKDIDFSYQNQKIFENFNFSISANQFIGIVGVNGSGKSTFLKLIMGLLYPQKGKVSVLNSPAGHFNIKHSMGSSLQDIDFPNTEKVFEVLHFVSQQFQSPIKTEKLIEDFSLNEFRNKACGQLSGGMKRRLSLACAFVGKPKIVLLDEPTTGLDSESRRRLMKNLKAYQEEHQALVMMISHHPEEIIDSVDQFFHVKDQSISTISPEKMTQLTSLRKISFRSSVKKNELPPSIKILEKEDFYEVISDDSDEFVRKLCSHQNSFENMRIKKIGIEELLGEVL